MKKSTRSSTDPDLYVAWSGFFALLVKPEPMHDRARAILARAAQARGRFVTPDYIRDETATLLRARGQGHLGPAFFESVFRSHACRVEWMYPERFEQTRRFFIKHLDQKWSFTDCFSFWLMRSLHLRDA